MSNVREILSRKGNNIYSVTPDTSVKDALVLMSERNVGALIVMEDNRIAGIFSERDFARHCAKNFHQPDQVKIKDMMTSKIMFVTPNHSTEECMSIMSTKRIRHLPVLDGQTILGLISIGDVVTKIIDDQKFSINQLERYVTGG